MSATFLPQLVNSLNGMGRSSFVCGRIAASVCCPLQPSTSLVSRFCGRGAINYSAVVIREKREGRETERGRPFHFLLLMTTAVTVGAQFVTHYPEMSLLQTSFTILFSLSLSI